MAMYEMTLPISLGQWLLVGAMILTGLVLMFRDGLQ
jgi:hypothetical protein